MATMRAALFRRHGGPEVLELADLPMPEPGPGEVLVKVHAAALNHLDLWVRDGWEGLKLPLPHVGGSDIAGTVAAVGPGVDGWSMGERVAVNPSLSDGTCDMCLVGEDCLCKEYRILGEHTWGGFAQYVKAPAASLHRVPEGFKMEVAAAAPLASMTAWRAIVTRGGVRAGETVLVIGGGGGVATFAIQIAKLAGARVIATTGSDEKAKRLRDLGADEVVNYRTEDWGRKVWALTGKRGADLVFDSVGEATFMTSMRCTARQGRIVTCGGTTGQQFQLDVRPLYWRGVDIRGSTMANRAETAAVLGLVWQGKLRPIVDRVLPLERIREAHELLERSQQFGKVVLTPP
jgi:NADPH:quinone reductase-like Zn-dependent oxidoreductase